MKNLATLLTLVLAVLFLVACGGGGDSGEGEADGVDVADDSVVAESDLGPHEAAVKELVAVMKGVESTLGEVESADSVKTLTPKFDALGQRMDALAKTLTELEAPSEEIAKLIEEQYTPQITDFKVKIEKQLNRISTIGIDAVTLVMNEMQKLEPEEQMPKWVK